MLMLVSNCQKSNKISQNIINNKNFSRIHLKLELTGALSGEFDFYRLEKLTCIYDQVLQ